MIAAFNNLQAQIAAGVTGPRSRRTVVREPDELGFDC